MPAGPASDRSRTLDPVTFVEEFATSKQRCAVLQRLFAYRKRLLDANPLWFTQLVVGPLIEPGIEPERANVHTYFVGGRDTPEKWQRRFPDLFVEASVRSRFSVEGRVVVATEPADMFRHARAMGLDVPDAVEVPFLTSIEEGAARATLETRQHDVRKGRALRSTSRGVAPTTPDSTVVLPTPTSSPNMADPASVDVLPDVAPSDALLEPVRARPLIAFDLGSKLPMRLRPAKHERDWIEASPGRYAARCLPLLIANQSGWEVVLEEGLVATWSGKPDITSVKIESSAAVRRAASSHFGQGILTFHLPYVFRTPPGYNLLIRGPSNRPKAGISPLEGVVETDWTAASFTMNWQITEVDKPVRFAAGDVIAMLVPQRRGELEHFEPRIERLLDDPDTASRHELFTQSRSGFLKDLKKQESTAQEEGWQRYYFQGRDPDGTVAPEHQTKLKLKPFA